MGAIAYKRQMLKVYKRCCDAVTILVILIIILIELICLLLLYSRGILCTFCSARAAVATGV
jgi:hypothetical protein